jgi:hypothetical protein
MDHEGGESVLRDVGEPLPRRWTPGPTRRSGSHARRATDARIGEARGSRPDRNRGTDDGGRCLKGSDTSQTYL